MIEKDNIFSVTEVTRHIKNILENNIPSLVVEGEIANFTRHNSGHIYFSLKDNTSSLKCVFFRNQNLLLSFFPNDGDKVLCRGKITVYEKGGNYQLNVQKMYAAGIGELQLKFEELKRKLAAEGLFEADRKKIIPKFPEKIGIITSETGAAIQDIKSVITRRYPCRIFLFPSLVQGERAPRELIKGLDYFNQEHKVDLIIIGRGGGSQEDLFCFNDEELARAIAASKIPVISAVGHEIDFTIADFVADLRAPTPSAAAELAVPDGTELLRYLTEIFKKTVLNVKQIISENLLKLRDLDTELSFFHPRNILQTNQQSLDELTIKLGYLMEGYLKNFKNNLALLSSKLQELSPYNALKRGYSFILKNKKIINKGSELSPADLVDIILSEGKARCEIIEVSDSNEIKDQ